MLDHVPGDAKQLRPCCRCGCGTCLNQGFFWLRDRDFAKAWAKGPRRSSSRPSTDCGCWPGLSIPACPVTTPGASWSWGRFVERLQHQVSLLDAWDRVGRSPEDAPALSWAGLLRICGAYEFYCRTHSMVIRRDPTLAFLVRNPELPRSLCFAVHRIEQLLSGIDPEGRAILSERPIA